MFDPSDTIAAISSPPGFGFRGVVRLSGPTALTVVLDGFEGEGPERTVRRGALQTGAYRLDGLRPTLPATLLLWPGSRTYTGQPSAEIHTLGSPPLLQLLLTHCLTRGARLAEPGEFTLRAFLSGRIDLTQAEAVLGVIDARSPEQLESALGQLAGGLASPVATLRDRLLDILAHLEANLDFVDEPDVDELGRLELAGSLATAAAETAALADRLTSRDRPEGHATVVLVGPPNAGKSRLFNALLGQTRALVSPRPGTTRDYLSAVVEISEGLTIELLDTAGEETATTAIDARAQALRATVSRRADLLLKCVPADAPSPALELEQESGRPHLLVLTKSDLAERPPLRSEAIATSAETGAGLGALRDAIAARVGSQATASDLPTTTGARCRESLTLASAAIASAASTLALGLGDELVSVDLRQAADELGKVVGAVVTDDILDRIFRRFCIGK